jgi:YD repeat-containing protein
MAARRCLHPRTVGSVLALAAVLAGLLAAPSAHAALPTITGAVVSADPGPIVEGSVYFATTDILLGFTGFGSSGGFSFPLQPDRRLEGGVIIRVSASSVAFHYGKEERITVNCRFLASVFTCDPIPPVIIRVASMFANIRGAVQDSTGRPVEGAVVSAVPTDGGYVPVARTDAAGAYLLPPYDSRYPMFGRGVSVPEGGSHTYVVSVSLPTGGPPPNPQQVTVTGGVIVGASFGGRPPAPPENRPQETAQGPGDACSRVGKPITVTTGNMHTQQEDLASPSAFGRFAFTRTYNSQSTYVGPLGLGWTHPFDVELKELRPGVIRIRNGAGNVRFYELVAGSQDTYRVAAPARDTSTLVKQQAGGFTETERDGLRREFDTTGRLQTIQTRAGWRTLLTYANTHLATVTDPGGRTLSFTYSTTGQLTRVDGPGGLSAQYTYDTQGRLVAAADALGNRWTYTYTDTTPSRLASVRDANGHLVESHTYDTAGRVIATAEADGVRALTLRYVDSTHTEVTDSLNRVTIYTFGTFGDLLLVTQIQGPCTCGTPDSTFEYDAQGRRTRQTDARGNSTAFEYDAEGNLIKVTDALGQITASTYNSLGQVLTTTDLTGATTSFAYDGTTGFLRQVTDALGHSTTLTPEFHTLPGAVTNPRGHTTTFAYADTGLLTTLTDPTGAQTTFAYDPAGRLLSVTDALGGRTRYTYDQRGRLLTVTDPVGAVTQSSYDPAGNRTGLTDPNGRRTMYTYDAANRLIGVTDPALGTTAYTYDTESNLLTVTDAKGHTTTFASDAHNRLVRRTDPQGNSETFTYDPVGSLTARTDRKG